MQDSAITQETDANDDDGGERSPLRLILITALSTLAALAVLVIGGLWMFQGSIIYPGSGTHAAARPGWTESRTDVPGVGAVSTYEIAARPGKPTILFFHGNAYGYEGSVRATAAYVKAGMGVVIPEFPGYAGNPGKASQRTLEALGEASAQRLIKRGVKPEDLVVMGNSIGTGPAISAASYPNRRLIIVSGIDDLGEVARNKLPFIPAALVDGRWHNAQRLASVKSRITVVHAPDDTVVPYSQGDALAKAAKSDLIVVPGGHQLVFDAGFQEAMAVSIQR